MDGECESRRLGHEDWEIDDPAAADLDGVRRIRDEIDARVRRLLAELAPASG